MSEQDQSTPPVDLIDEQTIFTLAELCRSCSVEADVIEAMVEQGILEPTGKRRRHWCFPASSLRHTRITLHLQRDLGVNLAGAAVAIDLLERIEGARGPIAHDEGHSKALTGKDTRVVELKRSIVMSGLIDIYIHARRGALATLALAFPVTSSLNEINAAVKKYVADAKLKKGEWVA